MKNCDDTLRAGISLSSIFGAPNVYDFAFLRSDSINCGARGEVEVFTPSHRRQLDSSTRSVFFKRRSDQSTIHAQIS